MKERLIDIIRDKDVLYIATKNLDYIRITQEIELIERHAKSLEVIAYDDKSYMRRIPKVWWKLMTTDMKDFDVVFVGFMAQTILPFFSPLFRSKTVVVDFFISIYDTLVDDRKRYRENSFIAKILRWFDRTTLRRSDYVVCDTKAHGEYFADDLGADRDNLIVLYLEADRSIYYPMAVEKKPLYRDKFVVLYFGSILPLQGVEVVLDCARAMEGHEDIFFVMIGPLKGEQRAKYASLGNIEFIDWLPQEELARHIAMADLCLSGHFNSDIGKARRTIAGKTYIYRAMEKPVILGENSANRELFSEEDEGIYFVEMGNFDALKDKILDIYSGGCKS